MSKKVSSLWEKIRTEPLLASLIFLLVLLTGLLVSVMFCEPCAEWVGQRLGLYTKNKTLQFLGIGMGGVLLALQALMSYKRAKALEDTANAQAEAAKAQAKATEEQAKANQNTEQGQRQERLKNAIEHLGHDKDSVRLGGAYELFHLAEETAEDKKDLRQTVLDILCAHIRQTTGENAYREKYKSRPSEEIQSLLTLLFVQEHEVFKGCSINLQGSWLNGVEISGARLWKVNLDGASLQRAALRSANLQEAQFYWARLQGADIIFAHLQEASLHCADLRVANLGGAELRGAYLTEARLQGASLIGTRLHGAYLGKACLHAANLSYAELQGAGLERAQLQETRLDKAILKGVTSQEGTHIRFERQIRSQIGTASDLSGIVFEGGLSQQDLESFVGGLPDEKARELQGKLISHVGKRASHELPENSGAIIAPYTAEEAEQWIAEYNEAMSEVPEESDN